ncbi:MAG: hypothetical protein DMF56_01770 [Acidobacteria bacterium]|nr:MAG: hypothetical protein DMF56_01770 [Acidobacteriota bacterium]
MTETREASREHLADITGAENANANFLHGVSLSRARARARGGASKREARPPRARKRARARARSGARLRRAFGRVEDAPEARTTPQAVTKGPRSWLAETGIRCTFLS